MSQYYRALAGSKEIAPYNIRPGFYGNDFRFSVAVGKSIIGNKGVRIKFTLFGYAYPDNFTRIGGQRYSESKVIMVYGVKVISALLVF